MALVVFGLVVLQNFLYKKFWQEGLSMNIRFSSKEAFEGDGLFLYQELSNKKILPLPWVLMKFNLSSNLIFEDAPKDGIDRPELSRQSALFSVMMYQNVKRKLKFTCGKRGFYRIRAARITCNNLLHTKHFDAGLDCHSELTVFPKILDNYEEFGLMYKSLDAAMLSSSLINPDPFEFKGLREYNPTDPLRNVNFKATAVAQQLMVNIYAPTSSKRLEIVLNVEHHSQYPNFELYEQGIRLAATVASRYINEDVKVSLSTNGGDVYLGNQIRIQGGNSPAHLYSILEALARVETIFRAAPISPYLNEVNDLDVVYLIISSYHGEDFLQAIEGMKDRGLDYFVIVPTDTSEKSENNAPIESDRLKIWEAL